MKRHLKPRRYIFYKKFKIDLWGYFFYLRKKNLTAYRFLQFFILKVTKLNPVINQVFRAIVSKKNSSRRKQHFSVKATTVRNISINNENLPNFLDFFKNYSKRTKFLKKVFRFPSTNWLGRFYWYIYYSYRPNKKKRIRKKKFIKNNIFKVKPHVVFQNKVALWLQRKRLEFLMFKFYGFQNLKKFKKIQELHFFKTRLRSYCLFFENYLCVFVLRTNFGLTMHFSKTGVLLSFFAVNKEIITNPFFKFKLGDDISVNKHKFHILYPRVFEVFQTKKALINVPGYIYFDYSSCVGSIWRMPLKYEVCGPIDFNIRQGAYSYSYSGAYFK